MLLEFHSKWTTMLGRGESQCRTGSGNVDEVRVRRDAGRWIAGRVSPVFHGDEVCIPVKDTR